MNIRSVVILLAAIVWLGCSDSNGSNTSGSANLTGDLTGRITLADYRGYEKDDKSGVLVQCDGTSYSAITDTAGVWTIHDLPTRTYSLTFSKGECDTWKDRSFSFTGGGTLRYKYSYKSASTFFTAYSVPIRELPRFTLTLDLILPYYVYSDSAKSYIYVTGGIYGHTSNDTPPGTLNAFCISSKSSNLSFENKASYKNFYWYNQDVYNFDFYTHSNNKDTSANLLIPYFPDLLQGFSKGDTVYIRVYPGIGKDSYFDAIEDKTVPIGFSNNGSNVLSMVIP